MNHDENYNLLYDISQNERNINNNYNSNNHNNELDDINDSDPDKITIIFVLISAISLVVLDILSLYYSFDYLYFYLSFHSDNFYDQCVESRIIAEIFFTVFATMAGVSATILSIGFLINSEFFIEKYFGSFAYFNYFIFGPFLLGTGIYGFINFEKIGYSCEELPNNSTMNLSMLICLIFILTLGSIVTAGFSTVNLLEYFHDSIKFTNDSNYLLGKLFWKYSWSRVGNRRINFHERNE